MDIAGPQNLNRIYRYIGAQTKGSRLSIKDK
jgi:hypothetical protein